MEIKVFLRIYVILYSTWLEIEKRKKEIGTIRVFLWLNWFIFYDSTKMKRDVSIILHSIQKKMEKSKFLYDNSVKEEKDSLAEWKNAYRLFSKACTRYESWGKKEQISGEVISEGVWKKNCAENKGEERHDRGCVFADKSGEKRRVLEKYISIGERRLIAKTSNTVE